MNKKYLKPLTLFLKWKLHSNPWNKSLKMPNNFGDWLMKSGGTRKRNE